MSPLTTFLSRLIGLFSILVSLSLVTHKQATVETLTAFGEAETWILDRKAHGPFAFETICEALAIQPDHLRDGIRQWRTQLSNGPDSRRLQRHTVR